MPNGIVMIRSTSRADERVAEREPGHRRPARSRSGAAASNARLCPDPGLQRTAGRVPRSERASSRVPARARTRELARSWRPPRSSVSKPWRRTPATGERVRGRAGEQLPAVTSVAPFQLADAASPSPGVAIARGGSTGRPPRAAVGAVGVGVAGQREVEQQLAVRGRSRTRGAPRPQPMNMPPPGRACALPSAIASTPSGCVSSRATVAVRVRSSTCEVSDAATRPDLRRRLVVEQRDRPVGQPARVVLPGEADAGAEREVAAQPAEPPEHARRCAGRSCRSPTCCAPRPAGRRRGPRRSS